MTQKQAYTRKRYSRYARITALIVLFLAICLSLYTAAFSSWIFSVIALLGGFAGFALLFVLASINDNLTDANFHP